MNRTAETAPSLSANLAGLLDDLPGMAYMCSADAPWTLDYVSSGAMALTGYSSAELSGIGSWRAKITHPEDLPDVLLAIDRCIGSGEQFSITYRVVHSASAPRWVLERGQAKYEDGLPRKLEGFLTDVSEQKRIEADLRRSADRLLLAQKSGGIGMFEGTIADGVLTGSSEFFQLYGWPCETNTVSDQEWLDRVHPEDLQPHLAQFRRALVADTCFASEYRICRIDGEIRWISSQLTIERNGQGTPERVVGIQEDITERKRNELLWEALLASIPDGLVVADEDGTIISVSTTAEKLFGYPEGELIGENLRRLMPAAHATQHDGYLARYAKTGDRHVIGKTNILSPMRRDGQVFPAEIAIGEAHFAGKRTYFGFVRDISSRRAAEDRLRGLQTEFAQVSRLSAVGQLAGSLAHELNQPLAAIANYAAVCRKTLEKSASLSVRLAEPLRGISEQALRAGSIIRAMRNFVAGKTLRRTPSSLRGLIDDAALLALIGKEGRGVLFAVSGTKGMIVDVDPVQIQQVIFNLIRNSVEAMSTRAHRAITVSCYTLPNNYIKVKVEDTGCGIEGSVDPFELFHTTKEEGMGLGLALCRSIIEGHGGTMSREECEIGAVFSFTLPGSVVTES